MMNTITVKNEFGKDEQLEILEVLNVDNNEYVIVAEPDSDLAHAYRTSIVGNFKEYTSIGAGSEFKKVLNAYNSKSK